MPNEENKLTEDQLTDQQVATTPATPATDADLANAGVDPNADLGGDLSVEETPVADGTEVVPEGEEVVAEEETVAPETFSAPAPGMVPSGWINIQDLATAVAQETGDVTVAETAPDAEAAVPGEETVAPAQPTLVDDGTQELTTEPSDLTLGESCEKKEEPLTEAEELKDEGKAALEIAKERDEELNDLANEIAVKPLDESYDLLDGIFEPRGNAARKTYNMIESQNKMEEFDSYLEEMYPEGIKERELNNLLSDEGSTILESLGLKENEVPVDDIVEEKVAPVIEESWEKRRKVDIKSLKEALGENEDFNLSALEGEEDFNTEDEMGSADEFEEEDLEAADDAEFNLETEIHTDDKEEATEEAVDSIRNTADFLDSLLDDEDFDYEEEDFEVENEFDELDEEDDFDMEESYERVPCKMPRQTKKDIPTNRKHFTMGRKGLNSESPMNESTIKYPAGSEPISETNNLVEAYKRTSSQRRQALKEFRKGLRENTSNEKFDRALRGVSRRETLNENTDSWENNRFIDHYTERKELDYKKLLEEGFLG